MSEKSSEAIRKLDESFGTYTNKTNTDLQGTVTESSEDDKKEPIGDNLTLNHVQPSTNDAPGQKVSDETTKEQDLISDAIVMKDKAEAEAKNTIDKAEEEAKETIGKVEEKAKEELEKEEALLREKEEKLYSQLKKEEAPVRAKIEEAVKNCPITESVDQLKETMETDPAKGCVEIAKCVLMVIGLISVLRFLFGRH